MQIHDERRGTEFYLKLENCKRFETDVNYEDYSWRQVNSDSVGQLKKEMEVRNA